MEETLQDLLLHRLAELQHDRRGRPVSLHLIAVRSFGRICEPVLRAILTGQRSVRLTDREIKGLAVALGLPRERVRSAADRAS